MPVNSEPAVSDVNTAHVSHPRNPEEANVNTTKLIKLPPFWRENPMLWFAQIEAGFALSRITSDETKFQYVILNLDSNVLPFVTDIITTPSALNKYEAVKNRIIASCDESKLRCL